MTSRFKQINLFLICIFIASLIVPVPSYSQQNAKYFPETGKTITGRFLDYWQNNGGLAQQGFPISDLMSEASPTDGKIYTMQYFERAIMEAHPENSAPSDVLLSLLGVFAYKEKHPDGAIGQIPNTAADSQLFNQTGKRLGGAFLRYWQSHGGLAQQGYPISDEFLEVSPLNGKQYKVQYFERAVFEYHPENSGTQYEVLLSQLGTYSWKAKQTSGKPTPTLPRVVETPVPTNTPGPDCSGIPQSDPNLVIAPNCVAYGVRYEVRATGFAPGEQVQEFVTRPTGTISGPYQDQADDKGQIIFGDERSITPIPGIWAWTLTGLSTNKRLVSYFKVTGPDYSRCKDGPPPPAQYASVSPVCGPIGTVFEIAAVGFRPGEKVGYYWTQPNDAVYGTRLQATASADGYVIGATLQHNSFALAGIWAVTLEGVESHHKGIAYLKLYR